MGLGQVRLGGWYEVGTVSAESDVEIHIRYGGYGGIGYYLVADSYIALFSRFSTCGAWEDIRAVGVFRWRKRDHLERAR